MRMRTGGLLWVALSLLAINVWLAGAQVNRPIPEQEPPRETEAVSLSCATVRELACLPGIGPRLAERIAAYRAGHPTMRPSDLVRVKGIGAKKARRLTGLIAE